MYRVVYCPDAAHMEAAEALAKEWGLPIQTGDSERTKGMAFDRTEVRVLMVPTDRGFIEVPQEFPAGALIKLTYLNDYTDCGTLTAVVASAGSSVSHNVRTMMLDAHRIMLPIIVSSPGQYELRIMDGDMALDMEILNVV